MEFIAKIHDGEKRILAVADKNLYGKEFTEGKLRLKINKFFNGDEITKKELVKLLKNAEVEIVNIVGNKVVEFLKEKDFLDDFIEVDGVKYSHIVFRGDRKNDRDNNIRNK